MEGGKRVASKVSEKLAPSAETIAAKNVDQIIDDTVGVDIKENNNEIDIKIKGGK